MICGKKYNKKKLMLKELMMINSILKINFKQEKKEYVINLQKII